MKKNRKRRFHDTYEALKSHQEVTDLRVGEVKNYIIEDLTINAMDYKVNKRRRSRVGVFQARKRR